MAGRRLLDLAKLVNASRNVAAQHLELRAKQLDVYNKTSTLAKAVKNQTDRVTLTAQAAAALAKRLNEEVPRYAENLTSQNIRGRSDSIPRDETVATKNETDTGKRERLRRDRYERSERNARSEPIPQEELGVKQEAATRCPLPDGSILSSDAPTGRSTAVRDTYTQRLQPEPVKEPLEQEGRAEQIEPVDSDGFTIPTPRTTKHSTQRTKDLQRQAECQIPAVTTAASSSRGTDHDREVDHDRPKTESTAYSSLPRANIPRHTEGVQPESLNGDSVNADVFHVHPNVVAKGAGTAMEEPLEGIDLNVFRTSSVSDMLGVRKSRKEVPKFGFGRPHQQHAKDGIHPALRDSRDSSHTLDMTPDSPTATERIMAASNPKDSEDDMRRLAREVAKDAEQHAVSDVEVSTKFSAFG